jgi:outer membrane protein assembly factor BamB
MTKRNQRKPNAAAERFETSTSVRIIAACLAGCLFFAIFCSAPALCRAEQTASKEGDAAPAAAAEARDILDATEFRAGRLIVHVGCGDGKLTVALAAATPPANPRGNLVQGLDADPERVEAARKLVRDSGMYGRVSIDRLVGERLPYVDNLVNLLVVDHSPAISQAEMLRVLAPEGVAYVRAGDSWTQLVKPRPASIDNWTHYLYDPSNNAVAHDKEVGPPRHLQWISSPTWSRHHDHMASLSALVSDCGRIFYIMDEGPREAIILPSKWTLTARDAFNGVTLWKRPIDEWNTQLWPLKSGPNQLPRRLVAVGQRVYATLGIDAPVTAMDATTGETVREYEGTQHTDEILVSDGTLFALAGQAPNRWKSYRPNSTYVWDNSKRANSEWAWDQVPRSLLALDAQTGQLKWKHEQRIVPLTLTVDSRHVYFYDSETVVCLDRTNGNPLWKSEPVVRKNPFPTGYGPTLVVVDGVVLLSVENRIMHAFAAADGKSLWNAPHHQGGHASPDDMLVINGLVWSGAVAGTQDSGIFTGRDLHTGEVKVEFPPDVNPPWFHHRCYRSRATDNYFIASRTGLELIDVNAKHWDFNHWVRGGCLYGFMPCNGLIYAPPHACGCFLESKLFGFNALAGPSTSREVPREVPDQGRLEKGPAYDAPLSGRTSAPEEWPMYRHDAERSGAVAADISEQLGVKWQVKLDGRLSSVVAAADKVFIAAVDQHSVHAFDAATGRPIWVYTTGARIDSPPSVYRDRVLFGSADGYVYCVLADNGKLAWRFRAAPRDERLFSYEQLESVWPVSGSVLVYGDVVHCVAGRSAFLDGGMRLVRLDAKTGQKLSETVLDDRDPDTGANLQTKMLAQDMPVALPDLLSCDGHSIYMRAQAFDLDGKRRTVTPMRLDSAAVRRGAKPATTEECDVRPHLFSRTGFLDDSWFFRSYWILGREVDSNYGGWLRPGHFAPCGRIMSFDDKRVFGFDRKPEYLCNSAVQEYYLYSASRVINDEGIQRVKAATNRMNSLSPNKSASASDFELRKKFSLTEQNPSIYLWAKGTPPIQARAMVLANQRLFIAGPPDVLDEEEAWRAPDAPANRAKLEAQAAALQGRMGGQLLVFSAVDGQKLAGYELGTVPTFDGMAAAQDRLFLTTIDGRLLCLDRDGRPLAKATDAPLPALDTTIKPVQDAPKPASRAAEFETIRGAEVTASELGYHVLAEGKSIGVALKKLPTPLEGKVTLKCRMRTANDGRLKNGFVVFGETAAPDSLVECGLRYAMKKAVVVQGPLDGSKATTADFAPDESKVYDVAITVDLKSGTVTMNAAGATVTATVARPLKQIGFVGYAVTNSGCDFSPIEVAGN